VNAQRLLSLLDLSGKTALVTGASRGIGAATADLLAAAGANLVLCSRSIDAREVAQSFRERHGREPLVVRADIADREALWHVAEAAQARFGGVDILINNAAMNSNTSLLDATEDEWLRVAQVNLIGIANLCSLVAPGMIARKWGRIINIASNLGFFALQNKGIYSATKAGLIQLTRNMALEWAQHGILVNVIASGAINTDADREDSFARDYRAIASSILLGRLGTPEEIASVVLFLASPLSSFVTGETVVVDGGASIWFSH
jgi:NAD(P)-dependent dehydrogenase (short-subunit alcohol dehydrogenase family)